MTDAVLPVGEVLVWVVVEASELTDWISYRKDTPAGLVYLRPYRDPR